jgi:hypothetical protein
MPQAARDTHDAVKAAYLAKATAELTALQDAGLRMAGTAGAPVLLIKGTPTAQEAAGAAAFSGADGEALRKSLAALAYAPDGWSALVAAGPAGEPLAPQLLRTAIAALDPNTVIATDDAAAAALREAYAPELVRAPELAAATLVPGVVCHICGMRMLALGNFLGSLENQQEKLVMWQRLQEVRPLA